MSEDITTQEDQQTSVYKPQGERQGYFYRKALKGQAPDQLPDSSEEQAAWAAGVAARKQGVPVASDDDAEALRKRALRAEAIAEAGVHPNLAKLIPSDVPDGDFAAWIGANLDPGTIREAVSGGSFGNATNPLRVPQVSREDQVGERFERLRQQYGGIDHPEVADYYNRFRDVLVGWLSRRASARR